MIGPRTPTDVHLAKIDSSLIETLAVASSSSCCSSELLPCTASVLRPCLSWSYFTTVLEKRSKDMGSYINQIPILLACKYDACWRLLYEDPYWKRLLARTEAAKEDVRRHTNTNRVYWRGSRPRGSAGHAVTICKGAAVPDQRLPGQHGEHYQQCCF